VAAFFVFACLAVVVPGGDFFLVLVLLLLLFPGVVPAAAAAAAAAVAARTSPALTGASCAVFNTLATESPLGDARFLFFLACCLRLGDRRGEGWESDDSDDEEDDSAAL